MEGSITDDRPLDSAAVNAQQIGRNIRCFGMGDISRDTAAAKWQTKHGGTRVATDSIVSPNALTFRAVPDQIA